MSYFNNNEDEVSYESQHSKLRNTVNGFVREIEKILQENMIIPVAIYDVCFSFCCIFTEYQDLLCYVCGKNYVDKMVICTYECGERNDEYVRNKYSVLCPKHTENLGGRAYKSMVNIDIRD